MRRRGNTWIYVCAGLLVAVLAGCSADSGVKLESPPTPPTATTTTSPTPTPTPSGSSKAQKAIAVYTAFVATSSEAQRHPVAEGKHYPAKSNFAKYTDAPLSDQWHLYISALAVEGGKFRGTPPTPQPKVESIKTTDQGILVSLSDCRPVTDWVKYTHGQIRPAPTLAVPPPYPAKVHVAYVKKRWFVYEFEMDQSRTCTP